MSPPPVCQGRVNPNPGAVNAAQNVVLRKTRGRRCNDDCGIGSTPEQRRDNRKKRKKKYAAILGHKANAEAKKRVINPLHSPWKETHSSRNARPYMSGIMV
jgi:hypothetical protein